MNESRYSINLTREIYLLAVDVLALDDAGGIHPLGLAVARRRRARSAGDVRGAQDAYGEHGAHDAHDAHEADGANGASMAAKCAIRYPNHAVH